MSRPRADVEEMLPLVRGMVWSKFRRVPDHVAGQDDLVQVGMEAVCHAAPKWDPDLGTWRGYAYRRAWGAVQDHLRQASFGGRKHAHEVNVESLDAPIGEDDLTLGDVLPGDFEFPDPLLAGALARALASLPLDIQSALDLRYREDLTCAEVAQAMGVAEGSVFQWLHTGRAALRKHPALEGWAA